MCKHVVKLFTNFEIDLVFISSLRMNFVKNFTNRKTIFIFNKLSPIFL